MIKNKDEYMKAMLLLYVFDLRLTLMRVPDNPEEEVRNKIDKTIRDARRIATRLNNYNLDRTLPLDLDIALRWGYKHLAPVACTDYHKLEIKDRSHRKGLTLFEKDFLNRSQ